MAYLSTQPYRGTRDFYPEDKRVQNYIFNVWRLISEQFGYEEYGTPTLEPFELFAAKSGHDLVSEETYQFTDRGGRNVVIRPEMTPSVSRLVAGRRQELAYPVRWYSIANFMRYDRPQRGREREFWQLNADIFGVSTLDAEAEIISMADTIMKTFGAQPKMYMIKINSRKLINFVMADYLGLDIIQAQLMIKLFDKKDKISHEEFRDQALEIFDPNAVKEGLRKIADLLSAKTMSELPKQLLDSSAVKEVQVLFTLLRDHGVTNATFDIALMRGFDYYTGIVFEVFDNHPDNKRSMFGGGRYDGLVGLFGVEPVPTVGMAPGGTTMEDFLRAHKLIPASVLQSTTEAYMIVLGDTIKDAQKLARQLREEGVKVEVDITGRNLDKQIKTAIKKRIPYLIFIGKKEVEEELYTLKDVAKEEEQQLSFEHLVVAIKDYRRETDDDDLL